MSNDRKVAAQLLSTASDMVGVERTGHGDVEQSFTMIAMFWSTWLTHRNKGQFVNIEPVDVAQMMSLMKKARSAFNMANEDNSIDDLGYASLAGMLAKEEAPKVEDYSPLVEKTMPMKLPPLPPVPDFAAKVAEELKAS